MKAVERRQHLRILKVWQNLLTILEAAGPASESAEDLDGFGTVKDYILDRIEERRQTLGVQS